MPEIVESETYRTWFASLRDIVIRARILARIRRLGLGNPGRHRVLKRGIVELKIDAGPGFRIYVLMPGPRVAILLCGGDKSTQRQDIVDAMRIARDWSDR